MTNQEIYNKVVKHVRKQGQPSYDSKNNSCKYRLKLNRNTTLMCGIGCLIPNKEYVPQLDNMEMISHGSEDMNGVGFSVEDLVHGITDDGLKTPLVPSLVSKKRNLNLMKALQDAHDSAALYSDDHKSAFLDSFNERAETIAKDFRLKRVK